MWRVCCTTTFVYNSVVVVLMEVIKDGACRYTVLEIVTYKVGVTKHRRKFCTLYSLALNTLVPSKNLAPPLLPELLHPAMNSVPLPPWRFVSRREVLEAEVDLLLPPPVPPRSRSRAFLSGVATFWVFLKVRMCVCSYLFLGQGLSV